MEIVDEEPHFPPPIPRIVFKTSRYDMLKIPGALKPYSVTATVLSAAVATRLPVERFSAQSCKCQKCPGCCILEFLLATARQIAFLRGDDVEILATWGEMESSWLGNVPKRLRLELIRWARFELAQLHYVRGTYLIEFKRLLLALDSLRPLVE